MQFIRRNVCSLVIGQRSNDEVLLYNEQQTLEPINMADMALHRSVTEYLKSAKQRGLELVPRGPQLIVRPKELVTNDDKAFIVANKMMLINAILAEQFGVEPDEIDDMIMTIVPPPGAEILIADEKGHTNERRKGEPHIWTWIGAKSWYYVKDHPPP